MEFKAMIERKKTPLSKALTTIWILIVVAAIVRGFFVASEFDTHISHLNSSGNYSEHYAHEVSRTEIGIYLRFYESDTEYGNTSTRFYGTRFIVELAAIVLLFMIPIIIKAIREAWCRRLSLTLHDDRVTGTYGKFSTKSLSLPIEQLSSVSVIESFGDKLRSGKTLSIRSASGIVAIPFVQNADEFAEKALEAINKYKEERKGTASPANSAAPSSIADELKKFKDLLDSGAITEEEFNAKKKQLLGL